MSPFCRMRIRSAYSLLKLRESCARMSISEQLGLQNGIERDRWWVAGCPSPRRSSSYPVLRGTATTGSSSPKHQVVTSSLFYSVGIGKLHPRAGFALRKYPCSGSRQAAEQSEPRNGLPPSCLERSALHETAGDTKHSRPGRSCI